MLKEFSTSVEPWQWDYLNELVRAWRELDYHSEIQENIIRIEDELNKIKEYYKRINAQGAKRI